MAEHEFNKKKLANLIGDRLAQESMKPDDQIDYERCDFYDNLLEDIYADRADAINTMRDEALKKFKTRVGKTPEISSCQKPKRALAIAAVAAIVFVCVIPICAFIPSLRSIFIELLKLPVGSKIEENGVTYIGNGEAMEYKDIETLVKTYNIDILYPSSLEEDYKIEEVVLTESTGVNNIVVVFADNNISLVIMKDINFDEFQYQNKSNFEIYDNDCFTAYITEDNNVIIYKDEYLYYLNADDRTKIIYILDHMTKE